MSAIVGYIINMLPYMLITLPVYAVIRFFFIKGKGKPNYAREAAMLLFVLFIAGLASQTVIPKLELSPLGISAAHGRVHGNNFIPFYVIYDTAVEVFRNRNTNYFLINFLGNIIMFMPIGFFVPLLWRVRDRTVVLIGFCSSFFIEFCQLFMSRGTDVDDLLLNTAGVWLGLLVFRLFRRKKT